MKSNGKHNLSFTSFLFAPILVSVLEFQLSSIVSCILILISLAIAVNYEKHFSKVFGVTKLKAKYAAISIVALGYMLVANYAYEFRVGYLVLMPIIGYIVLYKDLARMDKEYNYKPNK